MDLMERTGSASVSNDGRHLRHCEVLLQPMGNEIKRAAWKVGSYQSWRRQ
jgi:hypothetical protein